MAYGTSNRTRSDKKEDNLDRHLKIDDQLTSHLKPVKIGDDITGLQLADKDVKIENDLTVNGNIIAGNPISDSTISGDNVKIDAASDISLDSKGAIHLKVNTDYISVWNSDVVFGWINMGVANTLTILSATNYDLALKSLGTGDIILDSSTGNFIAKRSGTEFSAADSAYAGMILGYTCIGLDEVAATYNLTTSYVVPTDELQVTFTAPPSGKVEIEIQIGMDVGSSNFGDLYAGLSTANATSGYSRLEDFHEVELFDGMTRGALRVIRHSWTLIGLTAGTSYQYWAGFKSSVTTGTPHLQWGGNATNEYPDFIMKATALPNTIST